MRSNQNVNINFFFNPVFANCTGTFSKLCNVTEACRGAYKHNIMSCPHENLMYMELHLLSLSCV
jgi:hypothetical protein